MCKSSIFSIFVLVYTTLAGVGSGSGENFPAKKVRIRPDPDPQPSLVVYEQPVVLICIGGHPFWTRHGPQLNSTNMG